MAGRNRVAVGGAAAGVGLTGALFDRAGIFSDDALRYSRYTSEVAGINQRLVASRLDEIATAVGRSEDELTPVLVEAEAAEHVSTYRQRLISRLGKETAEYGAGVMCDMFEQRVNRGTSPAVEDVAGALAANAVDARIIDQVVDVAVENAVATELGRDAVFQIEAITVCDQLLRVTGTSVIRWPTLFDQP
jgi:hypothetical protein